MIPEGKYMADVIGISFGAASTGNEQVAISFVINDGEHAGENLSYFGTFTENALEYTEKALRACGWDGDDLAELPALAEAGKLGPAQIVVRHEEYKGEKKVKVKFVNKPGGKFTFDAENAIEGQGLKSFAAKMKSQFSRNTSASTQARSNGRQAVREAKRDTRDAPPPGDNDVPDFLR